MRLGNFLDFLHRDTHSHAHALSCSSIHSFVRSFGLWLALSLVRSFVRSFIRSFVHSIFTELLIRQRNKVLANSFCPNVVELSPQLWDLERNIATEDVFVLNRLRAISKRWNLERSSPPKILFNIWLPTSQPSEDARLARRQHYGAVRMRKKARVFVR